MVSRVWGGDRPCLFPIIFKRIHPLFFGDPLTAIRGAAFAAAGRFGALERPHNNSVGASYTGPDSNGLEWAVLCTGAAFHTGIPFNDIRFFFIYLKHTVGTNNGAHTAAGAFIPVQRQCHYVF